jgi:hypothetical protein
MISRTGPTHLGGLGAILLTGLLLPGGAALATGHDLARPPSRGIPGAGSSPQDKVPSLPSPAGSCAGIPGGSLGCLLSSPLPSPKWFNTSQTGINPGYVLFGSTTQLAYDPGLDGGELVANGQPLTPGVSPSATWVRNTTGWHDITSALPVNPPELRGAEMDYDPGWGGILLEGGFAPPSPLYGMVSETWLFNGTGWHDITNATSPIDGTSPVLYGGNMVWDGAIHRMVYVNGCAQFDCGDGELSQTWELASHWSSLGNNSGPGNVSPLFLQASATAYDPALGDLVLFGGYNHLLYNNAFSVTDFTFLFNGTAWVNDTSHLQACEPACSYPGARASAGMTWDGQLGRIVLVGGLNNSSLFSDCWEFNGLEWARLPNTSAWWDPSGYDSNLLVNASAVAPCLLGYQDPVLEIPPIVGSASSTPSPVDANAATRLVFQGQNSSGSGPLLQYSLSTGAGAWVNGTLVEGAYPASWGVGVMVSYSTPGSYPAALTITDWYGVDGNLSIEVQVNPSILVSITLTPNSTEVGQPINASARADFGSLPYSFTWDFGDGSMAIGAATSHRYLAAGVYNITLEATDTGGGQTLVVASAEIYPALALQVTPAEARGEVGVPVRFTATPNGGTGQYSAILWDFGDGNFARGSLVSHIYDSFGEYAVSASLTDSLGFNATATVAIGITNSVAILSADAQPLRAVVREPVRFSLSTGGGVGPIGVSWEFGDGSAGSGPSPSHAYLSAGEYSATAWANDTAGGSVDIRFPILVVAAPSRTPPSANQSGAGAPTGVPLWAVLGTATAGAVGLAGGVVYLFRRVRERGGAPPRTSHRPPR